MPTGRPGLGAFGTLVLRFRLTIVFPYSTYSQELIWGTACHLIMSAQHCFFYFPMLQLTPVAEVDLGEGPGAPGAPGAPLFLVKGRNDRKEKRQQGK